MLTRHEHYVNRVVAQPDGRPASHSFDKTVRIWDMGTDKCVQVLTGHRYSVNGVVALSDGGAGIVPF